MKNPLYRSASIKRTTTKNNNKNCTASKNASAERNYFKSTNRSKADNHVAYIRRTHGGTTQKQKGADRLESQRSQSNEPWLFWLQMQTPHLAGEKKLVCLFPNGRAVFVNERLPQLSPSHTPWIYNDLAVFSARRVVGPCQQPFNSDSHINVLIHRVLN